MFYNDTMQPNISYSTDKQISPTDQQFFVFRCLFSESIENEMSINKDDLKFLHSCCIFHHCIKSIERLQGVINFKGNMSVVQYRFCANNCNNDETESKGCFTFSVIKEKSSHLNYIIESSAAQCGTLTSFGTCALRNGHIKISNANFSKNKADECSVFAIGEPTDESFSSFVTVEQNYAERFALGWQGSGEIKCSLMKSNIINNTINETRNLAQIISDNSLVEVSDCCLFDNNGILFKEDHSVMQGAMIVKNCYASNYTQTGNVESISIHTETTFNCLNHVAELLCEAKNIDCKTQINIKNKISCKENFFRGRFYTIGATHFFTS